MKECLIVAALMFAGWLLSLSQNAPAYEIWRSISH